MFSFCSALARSYLTLGRCEEGLQWVEAALRENSGLPALRTKLSLCGHLGRYQEAGDCMSRMREIGAEPTIAALAAGMPKSLAPAVAALYIEGLHKAGVPEG